jgi:hypothetical protein
MPHKILGDRKGLIRFLGDRKGLIAERNQSPLIAETDEYFSSGIFVCPEVTVRRRGQLLKNLPGA